jgi:hypothetical protein
VGVKARAVFAVGELGDAQDLWQPSVPGTPLMPTFWLLDQDGKDLGMFRTNAHVWRRGERIAHESGGALQIVESVPAAYAADFDGYLVVESIEQP